MVLVAVSIVTYLVRNGILISIKFRFQIFPFSQWLMMKKIRKREQKRFEILAYNVNGRFQIHDLRRCAKMLRNYVAFLVTNIKTLSQLNLKGISWCITISIASYFQFFVFSQHHEYAMLAEQIGSTMNSPRVRFETFFSQICYLYRQSLVCSFQ